MQGSVLGVDGRFVGCADSCPTLIQEHHLLRHCYMFGAGGHKPCVAIHSVRYPEKMTGNNPDSSSIEDRGAGVGRIVASLQPNRRASAAGIRPKCLP